MNIHHKINSRSWLNKSSNSKGGFIRMRKREYETSQSEIPYYPEINTYGGLRINKNEFFKLRF